MSTKSEIDALTGIRFFAALIVLLFHLGESFILPLFPDLAKVYLFMTYCGALGVDLFFVLSGFILAYNYADRFENNGMSEYKSFMTKRFARVYPLHAFTLFVIAIYIGFTYSSLDTLPNEFSISTFLQNLFLVHAWIIPAEVSWNDVSWSVSAEWFAYTFFPLFYAFTRLFKTNTSRLWGIGLLYLGMIVVSLLYINLILGGTFSLREIGILRLIFEFTIGMLTFDIYKASTSNKAPVNKWLMLLVLSTLFFPVGLLWSIPLFAWLIYLIASSRFPFNPLLQKPAVVYGGKISYSIYLMHGVFLVLYDAILPPESMIEASIALKITYTASFVILSILCAAAAFHIVEEPMRKRISKRFL